MSQLELTPENHQEDVIFPTGENHTLTIAYHPTPIVEINDLNFHFGNSILLPSPSTKDNPLVRATGGLNCLIKACQHILENDHYLLIVGHTDTAGRKKANLKVSQARADNVEFFLKGDASGWAAACKKHDTEDYQSILTWLGASYGWDCDPSGVDGKHGSKTQKALENFRDAYKSEFDKELPKSRRPKQEDWEAFFHLYEEYIKDAVDLEAARSAIKFAEPATLACGEYWPIEAKNKKNFRSATNRRVELVFCEEPFPDFSLDSPPGKLLYDSDLFYSSEFIDVEVQKPFLFSI